MHICINDSLVAVRRCCRTLTACCSAPESSASHMRWPLYRLNLQASFQKRALIVYIDPAIARQIQPIPISGAHEPSASPVAGGNTLQALKIARSVQTKRSIFVGFFCKRDL